MSALTASGLPVFGSTTFLTADGRPTFRTSGTNGINSDGTPVFGLPPLVTLVAVIPEALALYPLQNLGSGLGS